MRRWALIALICLVPATSSAASVSFGTTFSFGSSDVTDVGHGIYAAAHWGYPTLDLAINKIYLQFHALELVQGIVDKRITTGAAGYYTLREPKAGMFNGELALGGSFDVLSNTDYNNVSIVIQALGRAGIVTGTDLHFGLFVVPGVGIADIDGEFELAFTSMLQISMWL